MSAKKIKQKSPDLSKKTLEGKSCYGEVRIIRKDGKEVEVSINATSRKDCQGKAIGGFAILRDISEHKKAEKTITRAVEEWEKTFNAISDLIFIVDNDNVILKVNNAFAQILEMKPEEIVGNKCYELLHKRNAPWPKCPLEQTKKDGLYHVVEVNDPVISIPLLISTSPVVNSNGELIGAVHIAKDISERKEIEKELNKKLHALEVFQKAAVGRELKMVELKKKIKKLEEALSIAGKVSKEQRAKG